MSLNKETKPIKYENTGKYKTVLFLTIQFVMSIKSDGSKHRYVSLKAQLNISHLFTHS